MTGKCSRCTTPEAASRPAAKRAGYGRKERERRSDTVRAWVERHGWVCPGYLREEHPATDLTADHLDPLALGGAQGGVLSVLCRSCNSRKRDTLPTPKLAGLTVTLVAGPPCGGKNTYVKAHAGPQDLVVDYDALAVALQPAGATHGHVKAHRPFILEARDAILDRLVVGEHGVRRAWLIASAPALRDRQRYRRRYSADVVVVSSPEDICLRRAMAERPADWHGYVRNWFDAYEPDPMDTLVKGFDPGG